MTSRTVRGCAGLARANDILPSYSWGAAAGWFPHPPNPPPSIAPKKPPARPMAARGWTMALRRSRRTAASSSCSPRPRASSSYLTTGRSGRRRCAAWGGQGSLEGGRETKRGGRVPERGLGPVVRLSNTTTAATDHHRLQRILPSAAPEEGEPPCARRVEARATCTSCPPAASPTDAF